MFDKSYQLPIVKDYVSHWGLSQAVREFIQNAIDSGSPFAYHFTEHLDETPPSWSLTINSMYSHLEPKHLLLGMTSKADDDSKIGVFGEGFKLALLVLTRLGYDVEMRNGDKVWTPRFKMSKQFGVEVLTIDEHDYTDDNMGLTVVIRNINSVEMEQIKDSCLLMQKNVNVLHETSKGDILAGHAGRLYVGGIFICRTELKYGYNIKPSEVDLERDRETVSSWSLESTTFDMWKETAQWDLIAKMIEGEFPDVNHAQYTVPTEIANACYELFRRNNPGALAAGSQQQLRDMLDNGITDAVYLPGAYYGSVSQSANYRMETRVVEKMQLEPKDILSKWLLLYRKPLGKRAIEAFGQIVIEAQRWRRR